MASALAPLPFRDATVTRCCSCRSRCSVTVEDVTADPRSSQTDSRLAARCAAIASLGAAVIHFAVVPMHWRDWAPSGVFFVALAIFQLLWAFLAWIRPGALVLAAGIAVNAGAAGLWVTACVSGPPAGPAVGQPETVGAAGISVLLLQCYVVMGAAWAWARKYHPEQVSVVGRALVLMGANALMAGAVTIGLVATTQGHHHHHHGAVVEARGEHPATHQGPAQQRENPMPAPAPQQPVTDMGLRGGEPAPTAPSAPAGSDTAEDGHLHHHDG